MDDYMVVNPNTGAVRIWWNYGPDADWVNGWKFVEGGEIATGVPHANWATLRFPDINGDGRADYVYIGEGGALKHHMNTGSDGGEDVLFEAMGGIATGAASDISKLVFGDMDGDGRDDYLIWDDRGGLTGYLNQPTNREGVPLYVDQGPPKTIADGITQNYNFIHLADLDGDGKDDYAYIDAKGAVQLWWNRGAADTSMAIDGVRFADIDGDGLDDYVWLDAATGAATVFLNKGPNIDDSLGWLWEPLNNGAPIAAGAAPAWRAQGEVAGGVGTAGTHVRWAQLQATGRAAYVAADPGTGAVAAWLNGCDALGDARPRPPPKVECRSGAGCDDYACPEGQTPRCPVLGGPAAGYCQCFGEDKPQSRLLGNATRLPRPWRNGTVALDRPVRNAGLVAGGRMS